MAEQPVTRTRARQIHVWLSDQEADMLEALREHRGRTTLADPGGLTATQMIRLLIREATARELPGY